MSEFRHLSISQLANLTGKDRRTVTKKLKDIDPVEIKGKAKNYDPRMALPLIYEVVSLDDDSNEEKLNYSDEKAKLARAQTLKTKLDSERIEIQIKTMKKELLPIEVIETVWSKILGNFRSKVMALPKKLAPVHKTWKTVKEAEKAIKKEVYECLEELSELDDNEYDKELSAKGFI